MRVMSMSKVGKTLTPEEEIKKIGLKRIAQIFADKIGGINDTQITISVSECKGSVCPKLKPTAHIHLSRYDHRGTICVKRKALALSGREARFLMAHEVAHLGMRRHGLKHFAWIVFLLGLSPNQVNWEARLYHYAIEKLSTQKEVRV